MDDGIAAARAEAQFLRCVPCRCDLSAEAVDRRAETTSSRTPGVCDALRFGCWLHGAIFVADAEDRPSVVDDDLVELLQSGQASALFVT
jgi:hypothetical protein